jgi:hypothetical protein
MIRYRKSTVNRFLRLAANSSYHDIVAVGELMAKAKVDEATLQMALVGYQIEKQQIENHIRSLEAQLGGKGAVAGPGLVSPAPKRILSAAARQRIAMAQKKRWAEHRKRAAAAVMVAAQGA